jgi:hypothetical protein
MKTAAKRAHKHNGIDMPDLHLPQPKYQCQNQGKTGNGQIGKNHYALAIPTIY